MVRQSDEVFYAEDEVVVVGSAELQWLRRAAANNPRHLARLCTHRDVDDPLHEMTIVNLRDTYIRPHQNTAKPKSFLVLEGIMDVVSFDDAGRAIEVARLGPVGTAYPHYYRLHRTRYHTLRTQSEAVLFQETTIGPFRPGDTVFAPWAPAAEQADLCVRYLHKLDVAIDQFRRHVRRAPLA